MSDKNYGERNPCAVQTILSKSYRGGVFLCCYGLRKNITMEFLFDLQKALFIQMWKC